jgi:Flp pilus assembly protein TadD
VKKDRTRGRKQPPQASGRREGARWWPYALILLAGLIAYSNSLHGPFVFDDRGTILDNQTIEQIGPDVFRPPHETSVAGRPIANLSFALSYALGGRDVFAYHAINLAIHLACGLLIFGVIRRIPSLGEQAGRSIGVAVALIWTVHPLNTDAVDYITERTESLMAMWYLTTLYCAVRACEGQRRGGWDSAAIVACALGMATKESMVTAPVAVMLFDRVFLFASLRRAWQSRARLYLGLAATWVILAGLIATSPRELSAGFSAPDAAPWTYLLNQAVIITRYLRLAVWPRDLVLYYGWPLPLTVLTVLPQALLLLALVALTVWAMWKRPGVGVLGVFFFVTLAPTSSIVPVATEVGAERRMYLALIAVVTLAVLAVRRVVQANHLRTAVLAAAVLLLTIGTIVRNDEYQSSLRLAETSFERWPTPATHSMLGTELAAAGRLPEAEQHLRAAAPTYPPARFYLATVLDAEGRRGEAIAEFTAFVTTQPPQLDQVYQARSFLAADLLKDGRTDSAIDQYRAIIDTHPKDAVMMVRLGGLLLKSGRQQEAAAVFRKAVDVSPSDPIALNGLGIALATSGDADGAIPLFQRALEIEPANEHTKANLDRALAMRRR